MAGIFISFWVILSQKRKSSQFEMIFSWHIKEQSWTNNFQWIMWWIYFPFLCPQADWDFLKCVCYSNVFNNYLSQVFLLCLLCLNVHNILSSGFPLWGLVWGLLGAEGWGFLLLLIRMYLRDEKISAFQCLYNRCSHDAWWIHVPTASTLPRPSSCISSGVSHHCAVPSAAGT